VKSLLDKLGYKSGTPALAWHVPDSLREALAELTSGEDPSFSIAFVSSAKELRLATEEVAPAYRRGGHLWIAYPKKSGSILSDLTRDSGWEPVAALGLLAVTQVALDDDWSALRFRYRDEIRKLTRHSEQPDS
jgi:hypothetical protein